MALQSEANSTLCDIQPCSHTFLSVAAVKASSRSHSIFSQMLPNKLSSLPAVDVVDNCFADQLVSTNLGQNNCPDEPVQPSRENDAEAHDAVDPVGKVLVHVLAFFRRNERRNDEIDVAEHEEDDDGQRGTDWWVPVPGFAIEVKMDETCGHECVDNGERIGD